MNKLKMLPCIEKKDDAPKVKRHADGEIDYSDNYIVMLHNSIKLNKQASESKVVDVDEDGKPLTGRSNTAQIPEPPLLNLARSGF